MEPPSLAIDYLCGHFTPANIDRNFVKSSESEIFKSVGRLSDLKGYEPSEFMENLEQLEIGDNSDTDAAHMGLLEPASN